MSFHPPEPLPESKRPDAIELGPTGGIKEEPKSEYRDRAPKSGTAFDDESNPLFGVLGEGKFYRLNYEEQTNALKAFFRPYLDGERSFTERLQDPATAPRAYELLRQAYAQSGFSSIDRVILDRKILKGKAPKFSPEPLSEWVTQSLDDLEQQFGRTDLDEKSLRRLRTDAFYVVSEAQNTANAQNRHAIDEWLRRHFDELEALDPLFYDADGSKDEMSLYARANFFIHTEDEELADKLIDSMMRVRSRSAEQGGESDIDYRIIRPILAEWREKGDSLFERRHEQLVRSLVSQYGIDADIVRKWKESMICISLEQGKYEYSYEKNWNVVKSLEAKRKGSAAALYEEYGIANFGRYETDMLLHQLEVEDQDSPYGVTIYPEADHNGAFLQNGKQLYDASLQLRVGGFETRIVEAGSQRELARRLLRLHKKYSPAGNKFSFAIVGGHGSPNSVALGNEKELTPPPFPSPDKSDEERERELEQWRNSLSTDTGSFVTDDLLRGEGIQRALKEWFEEGAPKVLISCSTGADGGIAEKASLQASGEVIAPKIPTNVQKIDVSFDANGKPVFSVEYFEGTAARYAAGEAK